MLPNLTTLVSTPAERDHLVVKLKTVAQSVFKSKDPEIGSKLFIELPEELANELTKLEAANGSHDYREDIVDYCEKTISSLENLPVISLTLSYVPNDHQTKELVKLAQTKFSSESLVECVQDNDILGGVIVSFAGKYYDASLAKTVHQKISEHRLM